MESTIIFDYEWNLFYGFRVDFLYTPSTKKNWSPTLNLFHTIKSILNVHPFLLSQSCHLSLQGAFLISFIINLLHVYAFANA